MSQIETSELPLKSKGLIANKSLKSRTVRDSLKIFLVKEYMETKNFKMINFRQQTISSAVSREAVAQRCSVKKVFLEISQNSQENTCARVSFLIKLYA